jgi:hypothetical protein
MNLFGEMTLCDQCGDAHALGSPSQQAFGQFSFDLAFFGHDHQFINIEDQ